MGLIKCNDCGKQVSKNAEACPHCGSPIITEEKLSRKSKNKKIIIFSIIGIIIAAVAVLTTLKILNNNKEKKYIENYEEITEKIINSAVEVEDAAILYGKVWKNTIWETEDEETDAYTKDSTGSFYDDFNTSLSVLETSAKFSTTKNNIKSSYYEIESLMDEIKNPPKKYQKEHEIIEELFEKYEEFANLVLSPSGSYTSYSQKYNELDTELVTLWKKADKAF